MILTTGFILMNFTGDGFLTELLDGVIHKLLQPSDDFNDASKALLMDALDIVKSEVQVQRWRGAAAT